ncbi:Nucleotidylyl transferase [Gymnopus androsaceus JB14]|uniref:Nucleotidylyl transferase n=1 Tax=Gymnopus androsaceus JB14 TaxID=1447944 RepID=A0A6A4ILZ0_9AGAR|nr:Nucleotidylyl transferase [Gymnopus androsaceus JB14]
MASDPPVKAISSVLLLASLPSLSIPYFLGQAITEAATTAHNHLYIVLFSPFFNAGAISHTQSWKDVQRLLTFVYVQATKVAQDMDKIIMQIDVLLKSVDDPLPECIGECDMLYRISGDLVPISLPLPLLSIPHHWVSVDIDSASDPAVTPPEAEVTHPLSVVALGGTFDHLHPGHKILLSIAAWLANQKVIVGVSDHALLSSKSNAHILESLETRQANVRSFLEMFKPSRVQTPMDKGFEYDIVMISDTYGPTGTDPNIQGLVVSRETVGGAEKIAEYRKKKGFPALTTFEIDVISHTSPNEEDLGLKMSSTFIRNWIAGRQKQHHDKKEGEEEVVVKVKSSKLKEAKLDGLVPRMRNAKRIGHTSESEIWRRANLAAVVQ